MLVLEFRNPYFMSKFMCFWLNFLSSIRAARFSVEDLSGKKEDRNVKTRTLSVFMMET